MSISASRANAGGHARHLTFALALCVIVLTAIALRVALWWFQARGGAVQAGDPEEYYRAALHLLQGSYYDTGKWIRPPLYPLLLAGLFGIGGVNTTNALLLQAIVTGFGVLVFSWYAWQRFRRPRVALISALIAALYLPLASFGSAMFAEPLFVLLLLAGLAALDRAITSSGLLRWAALAGALLALATLTRAVGLFFIPLAALMLMLAGIGRPFAAGLRGSAAGLRAGAVLLVAAALVIGPWTLRNYLVHQRLIVVDTNGPISMWYGTIRSEAEQRAGEERIFALPNQADRQALATQMTLENIRRDPIGFVARARFKIASLLILQTRNYTTGSIIGLDSRNEQVVFVEAEHPLWMSILADLEYVPLMLLAIVGLWFSPDWRRTLPTLLFVALSMVLSAVTIGHPRLRLPIVCVLIPYAAFALGSLPRLGRRAWPQTLGVVLCGLLFLGLIYSSRYIPWARGELAALAGQSALARGDTATAEQNLTQALEQTPENALRMLALADLALARGDNAKALERYQQASAFEPRNVYAHTRQIELLTLAGRTAEAELLLGTIASYGRDTNDLYRYTWQRSLTPAPSQLVPGSAEVLGHFQGFAPETPDLPRGRWTLGDGMVRLAPTCGAVEVRLKGPAGRIVMVVRGGEADQVAAVTLTGAEQTVRLEPVAGVACDTQPTIVLISSTTSLLDLEQAPWMTGAAVIEARIQP